MEVALHAMVIQMRGSVRAKAVDGLGQCLSLAVSNPTKCYLCPAFAWQHSKYATQSLAWKAGDRICESSRISLCLLAA